MRGAAVLKHENPLPRPQRQSTIHHGDDLAGPRQNAPQVRGGIVAALSGVNIVTRVLRGDALEIRVQIGPRAGVGVFVDDQRRAGVLRRNTVAVPVFTPLARTTWATSSVIS